MLFNVNVLYNDSSNDEKDTEFSYKKIVNELLVISSLFSFLIFLATSGIL